MYKTSIRFNPVEAKFSSTYKVPAPKAVRILWDLYFYTNLFRDSTMSNRKPYARVAALLFMEHGIALQGQTVKRWYDRVDLYKKL